MIVANRPPTAAPACRAFLRRFSTELTDRGIRVARIRSGLAWRDSAGRLRWVHCLPYSRHVPRIYCSTHIVPRSLHTRLRATGGLPPAWRGEISAVAAELPLLAVWLADHANSGWHHHPLPVPEYRQWHWGREYRWSAAGNEAWMQYDRPVSQRRVSQCDTR